jgi:hypothetical protein
MRKSALGGWCGTGLVQRLDAVDISSTSGGGIVTCSLEPHRIDMSMIDGNSFLPPSENNVIRLDNMTFVEALKSGQSNYGSYVARLAGNGLAQEIGNSWFLSSNFRLLNLQAVARGPLLFPTKDNNESTATLAAQRSTPPHIYRAYACVSFIVTSFAHPLSTYNNRRFMSPYSDKLAFQASTQVGIRPGQRTALA